MRKNKLLNEVGKEFGISSKEAENEMIIAIKAGRENPDPRVQAHWNSLFGDRTPTLEEFIKVTTEQLDKKK